MNLFPLLGLRSRVIRIMLRKWIVGVTVLLAAVCAQAAAVEHIAIDGRDVAIWRPVGSAPRSGFPVIVFSHGFGGCNTQSTFLMQALAQAGYFVLAPNHADARCGSAKRVGLVGRTPRKRPQQPFRNAEAWNDATYADRRDDMEAVLNAVLRDKSFEGVPVDRDRVGLAGHSLGGYTVLGLAGGWPSWKDKRVKAVLALSPFCTPYAQTGDLKDMKVPVMYQGGTRDFGISPTVKKSSGAYDLSSSPKFYIEFEGAGHFAWTNLNDHYQQAISDYSIAFFDHYLRGDASPLQQLTTGPKPRQVSTVLADAR